MFNFILLFLVVFLTFPSFSSGSGCYSPGNSVEMWRFLPPDQQNTCAPGFYCPNLDPLNNATWAVACPPSAECSYVRLDTRQCEAQGLYEPQLCPEGYYCKSFREKAVCPSGYFCPPGTVSPRACTLLSACPAGSGVEHYYGAFLWIALFDIGLICLISAYRRREVIKATQSAARLGQSVDLPKEAQLTSLAANSASSDFVSSSGLSESFAKAHSAELPSLEFRFTDLSLYRPTSSAQKRAKEKNKPQNENSEEEAPIGLPVLDHISGCIHPGRVYAIIGASGAGKQKHLETLLPSSCSLIVLLCFIVQVNQLY
jgi:hypothetical protein